MNRLVIVGNGFDLAHGLPTSYADFMLWYFKKQIPEMLNRNETQSELFIYNNQNRTHLVNLLSEIHSSKIEGFEALSYILEQNSIFNFFTFKDYFPSQLFKKIFTNKWVDVEYVYFEVLNWISRMNNPKDLHRDAGVLILDLNKQFEYLKAELLLYINSIKDNPTYPSSKIDDALKEEISIYNAEKKCSENAPVDRVLLVNFNYTRTPYHYSDGNPKLSILDIHGQVNSPEKDCVFGWGDDISSDYRRIESLNKNDFLKNIKSIKYLNNSNYKELLRFLHSGSYQVQIMGHSCGLSDGTMLNTVFSHSNCKQIKIFYHDKGKDEDDFEEKNIEISRHFNNKALMREIVLGKDQCKALRC